MCALSGNAAAVGFGAAGIGAGAPVGHADHRPAAHGTGSLDRTPEGREGPAELAGIR
jgi:hypothetical protein